MYCQASNSTHWPRTPPQGELKYVLHCNRFQMVLEHRKTQAPREIGQPWREDTSGCGPDEAALYSTTRVLDKCGGERRTHCFHHFRTDTRHKV